jgi:hypothetical protein
MLFRWPFVTLVDLILACLPLDPRFAGSNPAEDDGFLRSIKIHSTPSFGGEVKPSVPCRKILQHVKEPCRVWKRYFVGKIQRTFPPQVSRASLLIVSAGKCDSSGGRIWIFYKSDADSQYIRNCLAIQWVPHSFLWKNRSELEANHFLFLESVVGQTQAWMPAFMLAYYAFPRRYEFGERRWNDIDRGQTKNSEKACPSATLSTTNPAWIDPGANPGLRGERLATNDLSHGTAKLTTYFHLVQRLRMHGAVPSLPYTSVWRHA